MKKMRFCFGFLEVSLACILHSEDLQVNLSGEVVQGNPCSVGGSRCFKLEGSKMTLIQELIGSIDLDSTEITCPITFCKKE